MSKKTNKLVLESLGLPVFEDIKTLSEQTRLSERLLYFLANEDAEGKYKTHYIPKKSGGQREINEPCYSLKILQKWVLERILYKIRVSSYSIGFKKEKGSPLARCADYHRNNLFVLKMDLKDFYPSITREKVFYQFYQLGYNEYASNLLANICTYHNSLPQGAVTSAHLANVVCYHMDMRIAGYCNKHDVSYSRYADDMTFSCDNRSSLSRVYTIVKKIIEDEDFKINEKKTRLMTPKNHKEVLGVTINDRLRKAPKETKRLVRAMIHQQITTGDYSKNNVIRGYVSYINSIESDYKTKVIKYINKLSPLASTKELAKAFNNNKLYAEIPDVKVPRKKRKVESTS